MATSGSRVELPESETAPSRRIGRRFLIAVSLIVFVALLAWIDGGYEDPVDGEVSLLDAFYYASVSVTTTGYGDIVPVSDGARLMTTLLVTPARVLFLILLVGTTLEVLAEGTRRSYRLGRWRSRLKDHIIICGFGSKGRAAANTLVAQGIGPERIVVIDESEDARRRATDMGFAAVVGNATSTDVLRAAEIESAGSIIVAPDRDDSAVLVTLTARELNPQATIASAVREEENVHLLRHGGANSVITSSGAAGRLLGLAIQTPDVVEVLEDLLTVGQGLDLVQRPVREEDIGPIEDVHSRDPVLAVVRDGTLIRFDDDRVSRLVAGDELVYLQSHNEHD